MFCTVLVCSCCIKLFYTKIAKLSKQKGYNCPICQQLWKKGQRSIQCNKCDQWVHGPSDHDTKGKKNKTCSLLTLDEFNLLDNPENVDSVWFCPTCEANMLPFCSENNEAFFNDLLEGDISDDVRLVPEGSFKTFIDECNSLRLELEEDSDNETIYHNINSKYHDIIDFNKIKTEEGSTFGIMHTNLASMNLHFDDVK